MSSIVGHACAGATVYLCGARFGAPPALALPALALLVLLAIAPDFDYLAWWLLRIDTDPRFTHSLAFGLAVAALAWGVTHARRRREPAFPGFLALAVAACSHVLLDLLVGVHPVPVLWPLPLPELNSPVGLLPSAGRLRLDNYYFWRNLLIECGVLMPFFALLIALARRVPVSRVAWIGPPVALLWLFFLVWSLRVHA